MENKNTSPAQEEFNKNLTEEQIQFVEFCEGLTSDAIEVEVEKINDTENIVNFTDLDTDDIEDIRLDMQEMTDLAKSLDLPAPTFKFEGFSTWDERENFLTGE